MKTRSFTIALVGNPNCGKTTLFNLLTQSGEAVGNRAGVTFSPKKEKLRRFGNLKAEIVDLPGIYSLSPYGNEEKVTANYLSKQEFDAVIAIIDATNLERGLLLILELIESSLPVVLALNMMDEVKREHISLDISQLSRELGIPIFPISAAHGIGIDDLVRGATSARASLPLGCKKDGNSLVRAAQRIAQKVVRYTAQGQTGMDRIDKIICRPIVGIPLFFAVIFLVFSLTFSGIGGAITHLLESTFRSCNALLTHVLEDRGVSEELRRFLIDGIFAGVFSVLSFMPQTAILFFLLTILEDSGYLVRAAFVMDRALRPFGLSGKAFIPLLIGFGCTVPAVMSTVTLEEKEKESTIYSLPFIPCNARLPVFLLLISSFFTKHKEIAAFLLYSLGIAVAMLSAMLRSRSKNGSSAPPLTVELPKYRMPRPINLMREVASKVQDFLVRAGTVVFLSCVITGLFGMLTPAFSFTNDGTKSILAKLGNHASPLFSVIGLGDPRIISALVMGFFAKESIVSTIEMLIPEGIVAVLSVPDAASLAVFSLLYAPCIATVAAIKRELGLRKACFVVFRCFFTAFWIAFVVRIGMRILLYFV